MNKDMSNTLTISKIGRHFPSSKLRYSWSFSLDSIQHSLVLTVSRISCIYRLELDGTLISKVKDWHSVRQSFEFSLRSHQLLVSNLGRPKLDFQLFIDGQTVSTDQDQVGLNFNNCLTEQGIFSPMTVENKTCHSDFENEEKQTVSPPLISEFQLNVAFVDKEGQGILNAQSEFHSLPHSPSDFSKIEEPILVRSSKSDIEPSSIHGVTELDIPVPESFDDPFTETLLENVDPIFVDTRFGPSLCPSIPELYRTGIAKYPMEMSGNCFSPTKRLDSPRKRLDTPRRRLDSPRKRLDSPRKRLDSPTKKLRYYCRTNSVLPIEMGSQGEDWIQAKKISSPFVEPSLLKSMYC